MTFESFSLKGIMVAGLSDMTKYWMALSSVRGVGPKTVRALVSRFGSPADVFSAPVIEIARMPRLNLLLAQEIIGAKAGLSGFEKFIRQMSKAGIEVLCPDSYEYPDLLKLTEDFPPILYKRGKPLAKGTPTVAIVGTRFPSSRGAEAAGRMAELLADMGFTIVSGLAIGIDTAAHKSALKAGGRTLAVLGSGLRMVYPRENLELADEIRIKGAILSECHPNELVSSQRLIQRNRIITGISSGVILVEPKDGALNAAKRALRQDRPVFIYDSGDSNISAGSLSKAFFPIHSENEIGTLLNRLQKTEGESGQMNLL